MNVVLDCFDQGETDLLLVNLNPLSVVEKFMHRVDVSKLNVRPCYLILRQRVPCDVRLSCCCLQDVTCMEPNRVCCCMLCPPGASQRAIY